MLPISYSIIIISVRRNFNVIVTDTDSFFAAGNDVLRYIGPNLRMRTTDVFDIRGSSAPVGKSDST